MRSDNKYLVSVSYTHLDVYKRQIGHLNKAAGTQSTYRGLGSIDITAAVRSLLLDVYKRQVIPCGLAVRRRF